MKNNLEGFKLAAKKQILQEVVDTYTKPVVTSKHNMEWTYYNQSPS